jgi:hypothetical protein
MPEKKGWKMTKFMKGMMLAGVAGLGLSLSACDSKAENAAEDQAAVVRASSDAVADQIDATADAASGAAADALENKADAVRAAGDNKADAMEDQADKMDKKPE